MKKEAEKKDFESTIFSISSKFQKISKELADEKRKNMQILQAIDEGIFFLDSKYNIQKDYSIIIEELIDQKNLANQNFIDLLENKIPENIINNTREYLDFMFREDLDNETIKELNPLSKVEFHYEDRWGLWTSSKYLSYSFNRIIQNGKIVKLICTIRDVSQLIELSAKLEEIEERTKTHMEWLVNILHVEPPLLNEFVSVIEYELNVIDNALKNSMASDSYAKTLKTIIRSTHHIRSTASLLDLPFFSSKAKEFEREITKIKNKSEISGSDFVPVVVLLGEVQQTLNDIKTLTQRLKHYRSSLRTTRRYEGGLLIRVIEDLIQTQAKESGKQIKFNCQAFDSSSIPYSHQQLVKEFLIILTRFAILYAIEKPEERKAANINPTATIEISTFTEKRSFGFRFQHDGHLIRIERLLQQAIESSADESEKDEYKKEDSSQLGSEVMRLLFMPSASSSSISEAEYSNEIFRAMHLVKKKLVMHGGRVKITFKSEDFCEYTITLPRKKNRIVKKQ
jgi:HPt (histidine-containing phosphotransfer) domain-containing protein